ncbi:MAG: sigma 54-interacting transcriptional regulator [Verrucomicrobiae bacterium]|nr:sigma 54-interacting transcriptional regulator [Verrucomicrobiae bacterium]
MHTLRLGADYQPEFDSLRERLLEMAQIRSVDQLMRRVVTLMAERPHVALARIWLVDKGDRCGRCRLRQECGNPSRCLHLVASAGRPYTDPIDWARLDGDYQRIPLGWGKIGQIGESGRALVVKDLAEDAGWLERPEWAILEGIHGFNGQPVLHHDEVLGVLAIFTRIPTPELGPAWLRIFADQIAVALVNARAFEEIERLRAQLELENTYLQEELREARSFGELVGQSRALHQVLRRIELVAPTEATVLILGESGTGKELVAREVHRRSRRAGRPLIRVNCAAVPRELFESEFFGHAKGAFTGALKERAGRFEAADGGTLFLDEVGEIPLELQGKFLRVLQEGQYERLGEDRTRTVDVRILAATNRNLEAEVAAGRFRADLFYRLNVFPIQVPPLRERLEDIPLLASHFLRLAARRLGMAEPPLSAADVMRLQSYDWPGNVRELQNVIERAVILARGGRLALDLPGTELEVAAPQPAGAVPVRSGARGILTEAQMRELERENLRAALEATGWRVHGPRGAAALLGIKPTTLASRMQKLGLRRPSRGGK